MKKFNKTKLAAAVGTATLALAAANPASAVVVVGGDNGWEISFDGNINAFYTYTKADAGFAPIVLGTLGSPGPTLAAYAVPGSFRDSNVVSGLLPAFFSFNVKSPTVNGLTGSARISFAPVVHSGGQKNQVFPGLGVPNATQGLQGANMETREVLFNLDGNFGTLSAGRTLSLFGRQAILNDMTLFGVGLTNLSGSGTSLGRIGRGYVYPNFNARFAYRTPVVNGFQGEIGVFEPSVDQSVTGGINIGGPGLLNETRSPRVEGEISYSTAFQNGNIKLWMDGMYQSIDSTAAVSDSVNVHGWGGGGVLGFMDFELTGYYYQGRGLGPSLQFFGGNRCVTSAFGVDCQAARNSGWYVQGTYTFMGQTKLGVSYGKSTQDGFGINPLSPAAPTADLDNDMLTVGIYHDVNSWFKLIAEYSNMRNQAEFGPFSTSAKADSFSVGTFFMW